MCQLLLFPGGTMSAHGGEIGKRQQQQQQQPGATSRGTGAGWKRHIIGQLKHRDRNQKGRFQDVIQSYNKLLEKSSLLKQLTENIQTEPARFHEEVLGPPRLPDIDVQQKEIEELEAYNGKLAVEACQLRARTQEQEDIMRIQSIRVTDLSDTLESRINHKNQLLDDLALIVATNADLKEDYDHIHSQKQRLEAEYQNKVVALMSITDDIMKRKAADAENQNKLNDRRKEELWRRQIKKALRKSVSTDAGLEHAQTSRGTETPGSPEVEGTVKKTRSQSMISLGTSKFMGTIRNVLGLSFRKETVDLPNEGNWHHSSNVCVLCCVPTKALCNKEVHESEVHAVQFSPNSRMVATGGADRVIKIWNVNHGMLQVCRTLEGSGGGITSIEFDPSGLHILAASFDGAAHLWKLDGKAYESLTGHTGKVTAAKFKMSLHRAVTCSLDRTIREWDLQKAACTRRISVSSYCSDVVCSDYYMISGHHDKKIRFWDSRSENCFREVTLEEKITSLFMDQEQGQLLSCSRDDVLSLFDLRTSIVRQVFRADGFKCGCDWTKAILSPDGNYTTAGSADGTIFIWNTRTGLLERSLNGQHKTSVNAVTWSVSGDYVVSVDRGKMAVLWSDY
ncbi:protein Atg16l2 [Xenopus laevis]|uniref:Protein Atg16l2 n=2 Tax=Xenopus laevis TaxID=8355 RepID=A0A8J0UG55_XENLA|nr:protein Atg16l2 [Xenopus laevis]